MADVRALLRQQREARRIEHPHAAYSDAGKLLCTVCHEHIKTEALWDGHLRSAGHRQRLQLRASAATKENGHPGDGNTHNDVRNGAGTKRKLDDDVDMGNADEQAAAQEDNVRKKRSRPDMTLGELTPSKNQDSKASTANNHKPITPPLNRRQSGTPTLGVEMQIPSRPATPGGMPQSAGGSSAGGSTSTATTPKTAGSFARSPLIQHDSSSMAAAQTAGSQIPTFRPPAPAPLTTASAPSNIPPVIEVNEDEWAAFEAELVHGQNTTSSKPSTNAKAIIESGAAISAPALTAEESAARSTDGEQTERRAAADIEIEDEREEATRALETEFEVMEELEARAKRLRERREALRLRGGIGADAAAPSSGGGGGDSASGVGVAMGKAAVTAAASLGKENAPEVEEEDDDEEDEDETDDWVGFRFRS